MEHPITFVHFLATVFRMLDVAICCNELRQIPGNPKLPFRNTSIYLQTQRQLIKKCLIRSRTELELLLRKLSPTLFLEIYLVFSIQGHLDQFSWKRVGTESCSNVDFQEQVWFCYSMKVEIGSDHGLRSASLLPEHSTGVWRKCAGEVPVQDRDLAYILLLHPFL